MKGHKIPRFIRRFSRWMRRLAELQYYDAETSRLIRRWFSPKNRFHGFGYSTTVNTIDPGPRSLREGTRQKIHAFTAMIQQHPVYLAFPPEDWRKIQFIVDIVKPALPGELREAYPKEKALVGRLLSDLNFALANGYFTPEQTRDLSQYFEVAGRVGEARQRRNGQRELMLFLVENLKRPEPERMSYEDWRQLLKSVRFDKVRLKTYPKRQPRIHLDPGLIQHPPEGIAERVWNRLSQSHREVVYLGHQGFRPPDIASSLGIRKSSAEKYLQEAKKQLGMGDDN